MNVAIIVIASVVGVGLLLFFVNKLENWLGGERDETGARKKRGLKDVKEWFINHRPSKRRLIQVYAALLYNANIKGYISGNIYQSKTTKYLCVPGLNCYSCPGAVGACPLGALQNSLAESNTRAPYYVLGILALFAITLARTVCGFLCPVGLAQELLYKVRTPKLKKSRVTRVLSYFKYVILALTIAIPLIYAMFDIPLPAFCKYICPAGTFEGAILLLSNPGNANLFAQLGWQFTWKLSLLVVFVVASMFIFRVFCRFICPLGALYGFFNKFAVIGVYVEKNDCTDCGLCVSHCKMDVARVGDHECINCGECMAVCPTKAISWKGSKIFLRGRQVEEAETLKPIAVTAGVATIAPVNEQRAEVAAIASTSATEPAATKNAGVKPERQPDTEKKPKKRGARFWVEVAAWIAALLVLVTAIVMYNFVDVDKKPSDRPPIGADSVVGSYQSAAGKLVVNADGTFTVTESTVSFAGTWKKEDDGYIFTGTDSTSVEISYLVTVDKDKSVKFYTIIGETPSEIPEFEFDAAEPGPTVGNKVGDTSPDFTVSLYTGGADEFNLYANRGKMTVINYWATWCTPCVKEIPYFNELAVNHPELDVVAIHSESISADVMRYITRNWGDYSIKFAQDKSGDEQTFTMYGGTSMWPMTVIVDAQGKIVYNSTKSFHDADELEALVAGLLAEQAEAEKSAE